MLRRVSQASVSPGEIWRHLPAARPEGNEGDEGV